MSDTSDHPLVPAQRVKEAGLLASDADRLGQIEEVAMRFGLGMAAAVLLIPVLFGGIFVAWLSSHWSDPAASSLIIFLRGILAGG